MVLSRIGGRKNMPRTSQSTRYVIIRNMRSAMLLPSEVWLAEIVVSTTIMKTAMTSSITSEPITRPVYFSPSRPISLKHFCMTTVELIESMAPRNTAFILFIPASMPNP